MNVAIIVAAGQGTRMGGGRAKQFLELAGIPIVIHTLKVFEECEAIQEVVVVLAATEAAGFLSLVGDYHLRKLSKVVPGGRTRCESVKRGLDAVRPTTAEVVAVHDGVRPFVTADEITRTVAAAVANDAAVLVAPVNDTIKEVADKRIIRSVDRRTLRRALTPQCFRYALLRRAYESVDVLNPALTDESALVESLGQKVALVEGSSRNIKITTKEDLVIAEAILKSGLWL